MCIYFTFILERFFSLCREFLVEVFFFPDAVVSFPSGYFQDCILSNLWFSLHLSCLGFIEILESVNVGFIPNLKTFQPLFHQVFFYPILSLFSFRDCSYSHGRLFYVVLKVWGSVQFYFPIFLFSQFFRLNNFYWPIFKFTDSLLYYLYSVKLTQWFFASFIYCIFLILELPVVSL